MSLEHDHAAHEHEHQHGEHDEPGGHQDHDEHAGHDHEGHQHVAYPDAVANYRAEKDEFFRTAHDSPIPHDERHGFKGLSYFPVDEALRFEGLTLEPYNGSESTSIQVPTTDDKVRDAVRAGVFRFDVRGGTQTLAGYRFKGRGSDSLWVPFLDATSGTETYGAGRYLDLYPEDDGTYALDFNLAYHPTCVYDPHVSCPLTPAENRLPIRVEAGERLP